LIKAMTSWCNSKRSMFESHELENRKIRSPIDLRENYHSLLVRKLVLACPTTQREASPILNIEAKGFVVAARMFSPQLRLFSCSPLPSAVAI
jgi:hypothetical protein